MAKKFYQIADKLDSRKIAEFLSKDGQLLLPFLELICNTEQAVDELMVWSAASLKAWMRSLRSMRWDCQSLFVAVLARRI